MPDREHPSQQNRGAGGKDEEQLLQFRGPLQEKIQLAGAVPAGVHKKHKGDSIVDLPQLQVDKILEHKVDNFHAIKRQNNVPNIAIKQHNSCQKE